MPGSVTVAVTRMAKGVQEKLNQVDLQSGRMSKICSQCGGH